MGAVKFPKEKISKINNISPKKNLFTPGLFKKRKIPAIICIVLAGFLLAWGFSALGGKSALLATIKGFIAGEAAKKTGEEPAEQAVPARTVKTVKTDYKDFITSFGVIKGFREIPVKFDEPRKIVKYYFEEGEPIKKGSLIVSEEQDEQRIKVEYAQIEYDKNKALYSLGAITENKLRQSELELETAKAVLSRRNFCAPADGFIGVRRVSEGELASVNEAVTTFVETGSVFCEVGVIEKDIDKVKPGQQAKVYIEALSGRTFDGAVDSVSPMLEGRSRTQAAKILITNDKDIIKPGMFAKADIMIFEKKGAIVIPRKALHKTEEGYMVFGVIRPEGGAKKGPAGLEEAAAKLMPVKVERASEEAALISEGLEEGTEIILETPEAKSSIKDGSLIEILPPAAE